MRGKIVRWWRRWVNVVVEAVVVVLVSVLVDKKVIVVSGCWLLVQGRARTCRL
jgi:hypothetical protein